MRKVFRLVISGIAGVLTLLVGGLTVFTAETVVDELGYQALVRKIIKSGWSAMVESGYLQWAFWLALVFLGGAVALWIDHFFRPTAPFSETKKKITKRIVGQHFNNKEVHLDGMEYENCSFKNVTFVYNGGLFEFHNNSVDGFGVKTEVEEMNRFLKFLYEFDLISVPAKGNKGAVLKTGFTNSRKVISKAESPDSQ